MLLHVLGQPRHKLVTLIVRLIYLSHTIYEPNITEYSRWEWINNNENSRGKLERKAEKKFQPGTELVYYYSEKNPTNIRLSKRGTDIYYGFFWTFVSLGIVICCIGMIILMIVVVVLSICSLM